MATNAFSTSPQTALVPRQEVLPAAPLASERLYLDAMAQPPTGGISGWWADMQRRRNALKLGNELFAEVQKAFQGSLLARYNLSLQLEQGIIEEENRLHLALARSQADDLIQQDQNRRNAARRMEMVRQLFVIQRTLKHIGVPEETVERKIAQYVERLIDALGTELTTGGKNEPDE